MGYMDKGMAYELDLRCRAGVSFWVAGLASVREDFGPGIRKCKGQFASHRNDSVDTLNPKPQTHQRHDRFN